MMASQKFPDRFADTDALDDFMSLPSDDLIRELAKVEGDIMVLGVGGKMGPSLARLAKRAAPEKRVIGVARFSDPALPAQLESWGIEPIAADLLDREATERLPHVANIIFMAGRKFGATDDLDLTWAMNVHVPAIVAETFKESRIVAFSTGCVYPFVDVRHQGATEAMAPNPPPGEYANSCLGRERMFEHFSRRFGTPGRIIRLNYAIDMRYGVLLDVGRKVFENQPVDLTTGHFNCIWQGDANAMILRALGHCTTPTTPLNISGPETISVRALAEAFGRRLDKQPTFVNEEADSAWLVNTTAACTLFGYPGVTLGRMIDWIADWLAQGGVSWDKATQYQVRDGVFGAKG